MNNHKQQNWRAPSLFQPSNNHYRPAMDDKHVGLEGEVKRHEHTLSYSARASWKLHHEKRRFTTYHFEKSGWTGGKHELPRRTIPGRTVQGDRCCPQQSLLWLITWVVPLPSNSHHQDCDIFCRGSRTKPSFATFFLGWGTTQLITTY